jgi:hypothetical protein
VKLPPRMREITLKTIRLLRGIRDEDAAGIMLIRLTSRAYAMGLLVGLLLGSIAMAIACVLGALTRS